MASSSSRVGHRSPEVPRDQNIFRRSISPGGSPSLSRGSFAGIRNRWIELRGQIQQFEAVSEFRQMGIVGVGIDESGDHRQTLKVDHPRGSPDEGPHLVSVPTRTIFPSRTATPSAKGAWAATVMTFPLVRTRSAKSPFMFAPSLRGNGFESNPLGRVAPARQPLQKKAGCPSRRSAARLLIAMEAGDKMILPDLDEVGISRMQISILTGQRE